MADISGIKPVEKVENIEKPEPGFAVRPPETAQPEVVQGATVREVKKIPARDRLILVSISAARNGDILPVNNGDILGREYVGKDLLTVYDKVSRKHAKIIFFGGEWTIEDLNSTNGTYVNDRKLEPGEKCPLKAKNIIALSKSCEFLVEIGG